MQLFQLFQIQLLEVVQLQRDKAVPCLEQIIGQPRLGISRFAVIPFKSSF